MNDANEDMFEEPDKINGSLLFDFGVGLAPWGGDWPEYTTAIDAEITVWAEDEGPDTPNVTVGHMKIVVVRLAEALREGAEFFTRQLRFL